ncbi:Xylose operon regulatory protein [Novipirellula aureliae]|uniref:Xylose operon regulatory protein n=1 Tax=Novipirellula aureliae TaxID=2527966 RepID=A0A5C6DS94_9BACT|nr:DNA-binding transcriptional regulator [Novipirellula aureliae]TWU39125.1 Xylose operon regulatory protein [Novipirellula aureliae]
MSMSPRIILLLGAAREFDRGLLSGIARYASLHGPWTFYREPHGYFVRSTRTRFEELRAWKPDGAVCPTSRLDLIRRLNVPAIVLDVNQYDGKYPGVQSEDDKAGQLAGEHLLSLGLEHFAFCGFESMRWSQQRGAAFRSTIAEAGHQVDVFQPAHRRAATWAKEEPLIQSWLESLPKPVGLFCANDDRSANILECCRALDYGVPEDIAVIGVDDDPYVCEIANPPLSSVSMASDRAGYEAAELLYKMILGKEKMSGQRIIAPASGVVARQSTDIMMVRDADVRSALQYIRENVARPIQVRDVVKATRLSHRTLNDRFYRECGSSILKHLTAARVAHISKLLRGTSLPVWKIAQMVGFDSDHHFARYFRRATHFTPQEYRQKYSPP